VDFWFEHVRYRKRSPENTMAGAKAYEASLRHRLARGEHMDSMAPERQTFGQFAEVWFTSYVETNNKPSEQRRKRDVLRTSLVPYFGKTYLDAISKKDIELYKALEQGKGRGNKTINNKLTVLRKCLTTAHDWGALAKAPPAIKQLKCPPPITDFLTQEEAERLLAHAQGVIYEMILAALRTGMRRGEIRGLQWEAIDWDNRILTVRHSFCDYTQGLTSPKSNRERHIPLADDLYQVLRARRKATGYVFTNRRGRPFPQQTVLRYLRDIQTAAGLRKIGWHTLRHTFASHLATRVSLRTVQELLGHSTITMTMRYSHVSAFHLRAAIDLLSVPSAPMPKFGQPVGNHEAGEQKTMANAH